MILELVVPRLIDDLRTLAKTAARQQPGGSLSSVELVNEAYLRLNPSSEKEANWADRAHFLCAAAVAMRHILVDRSRKRRALVVDDAQMAMVLDRIECAYSDQVNLVELDRALDKLASVDARQAQLIELRYFGGLGAEETADVMGISVRTMSRLWRVATAWLKTEIEREM